MPMPTPTPATPTPAPAASLTVDTFLEAVCAGRGVPAVLFTSDVTLDATVPGWRFTVRGADAVAGQYSGWFAAPAILEELERLAVDGREVVTYLLSWVEAGVPHAAHHCHVLHLAPDGRIARDLFFCGGRWPADRLAEMAAAGTAV